MTAVNFVCAASGLVMLSVSLLILLATAQRRWMGANVTIGQWAGTFILCSVMSGLGVGLVATALNGSAS